MDLFDEFEEMDDFENNLNKYLNNIDSKTNTIKIYYVRHTYIKFCIKFKMFIKKLKNILYLFY